jgi:hypothetical protein
MEVKGARKMSETTDNSEKQRPKFSLLRVLVGVLVALLLIYIFLLPHPDRRYLAYRAVCGTNLKGLGNALNAYANDSGIMAYPTPGKWCDLLIRYYETDEIHPLARSLFVCRGAPAYDGQDACHYAINPNGRPNSPDDTVLLFETKGGWNQFGGSEILTTENHKGKGCNILSNDGNVKFVKTEQLEELNW